MKKIFYLLLFIFSLQPAIAQDEQPGDGKLREKMIEYIQTKLGLNRVEAEKFQPVFIEYLKEMRSANKDFKNRGDGKGLDFQQKIVEIRVRYRDQFKPIIGEKRSNEVFDHEREFVKEVKNEFKIRLQERQDRRADKRKNTELLSN